MLSAIAAEHVQNIRNRGPLPGATHIGTAGEPGEGAYVRLWLRIENGHVVDSSYDTHGCPASVAAASMAATLARCRTVDQAMRIEPQDVILVLHGLPEGKEGFADLAVHALRNALKETK